MHGIARKSALIMFVQILNGLLGYVGLKYIALYMEPWEYGVVGFAYGFVSIFSIIGTLGFDNTHVKKVSEGKDLGKCIATFAATKLFLTGLMSASLILFVFIWKFILNRGFETVYHEQALYIMLIYFVLTTLKQSFTSTFNARKETAKVQIPSFLFTAVKVVATILVAFYGLGVLALAYTYVIGEFISFIVAILLFKGYPVDKPSIAYLKEYTKFALPLAIASSSYIVMTNIDKVFIQLFWDANEVGLYFAIFNLSQFIFIFSSAVGTLLFPTISEYNVTKDLEEINKLTTKAERYISMITLPIIFALITLPKPVIHILISDKYMPATILLQIMPLFALMHALSEPYAVLAMGTGMPKIERNRLLIMVFLNVFLNLILIPKNIQSLNLNLFGLGAKGAAIATVASYFAGFVYIRINLLKITKAFWNRRQSKHISAVMVMSIFLWIVNEYFTILRWHELLCVILLGICMYLVILILLKEFTKDDFNFFIDTLNAKKMYRYIKKEIFNK